MLYALQGYLMTALHYIALHGRNTMDPVTLDEQGQMQLAKAPMIAGKWADIAGRPGTNHTELYRDASDLALTLAQELIQKGAELLIQDDYGFTPIHLVS